MQRCPFVGRIHGDAALERVGFESRARLHKRGQVGDCIVHPEAITEAFGAIGLVEIASPGRIDGHELEVEAIDPTRLSAS